MPRAGSHDKPVRGGAVATQKRTPQAPKLPSDAILNNNAMLTTFIVASGGACVGMMAAAQWEQWVSIAVPFAANVIVGLLLPVGPAWLVCCVMPLVTLYTAMVVTHPGVAVGLVSQAGVAALRVFAMLHYRSGLMGNIGTRLCVLQTIPIMESAVPRRGTWLQAVGRGVAYAAVNGGVAFGLHRGAILVLGRAFLRDSIFIGGALMGLIALIALQALDGIYNVCYAFPAKIEFSEKIQRDPVLALSLREFWNSRWDVSVANALRHGVYDPLHARFGWSKRAAALGAFGASAIIHMLQFVAWQAPLWASAAVFGFFLVQWVALEIERKVHVTSWKSKSLRRLWTWGILCLTGPLFTVPCIVVNATWDP